MTAWSQSYVESITFSGLESPNLWGAIVWGVSNWGFGSAPLPVRVKTIYSDSGSLTDAARISPQMVYVETESPTCTNSAEYLGDGAGYLYVFKDPSSNAENRDATVFTSGTAQSNTWTSGLAGSTTWS